MSGGLDSRTTAFAATSTVPCPEGKPSVSSVNPHIIARHRETISMTRMIAAEVQLGRSTSV